MYLKKLFYKVTNKDKHFFYKNSLKRDNHEKIIKRIYDSEIHNKIENIHNIIKNKKELSFSHCGHLGDVINSLPTVKELSKNHKCNFFIHAEKALENSAKNYKGFGDVVYLTNKTVDMLMPLFANLPYIQKTEKLKNQEIDIDFNLIREMPINFNIDSVRWYFHITGTHANLNEPYIYADPHKDVKNKVVIMRNTRRKNYIINYKFLKNYKDLLFIGLENEYMDLKKEIPKLEFYDCEDFLEVAEIIKASKFFLGNLSFGYTIAEGLKVPRLLESVPEFPLVYPNGGNGYDFYFQSHFEKLFDDLYNL
jgi:hypothetical protein